MGMFKDNSLVNYWPLDTNALDYKGTNPGIVTGAVPTVSGNRFIAGSLAYKFDESTTHINNGSISQTGALTIMAWVNPNNTTGLEGGIISNFDAGGGKCQYQIKIVDSAGTVKPVYCIANSAQQQVTANSAIPKNTLTHIVGRYDGSNIALFINGKLDISTAATQTPPAAGFGNTEIGRLGSYSGSGYFKGLIQEVALFNRALTNKEIQSYYQWATGIAPLMQKKSWLSNIVSSAINTAANFFAFFN